MFSILKRPAALLLFAALALLLIARGIVPAMTKVDTDFPNYFTAAKIVANGDGSERLYDDTWFQDQMRHYGIGKPSEGKFSPFTPPTALLLVPLTGLQPLAALRALTCVSVACLILSVIVLARILAWSLVDTAAFVLLSGFAVLNTLRLGQPYILVSLSCILGYYARLKHKPLLAGICFGSFLPIKYFSLVILGYCAVRKEWRVVLGAGIAVLTVALVSIWSLGWRLHEEYLRSVIGNHLIANLSMQNPFTATFQSFDTLFRRLFVFDARANPQPFIAFPALHVLGLVATKMLIAAVAVAMLIKLHRNPRGSVAGPSIGILGIVVLLLAPATATYHFVLLWLPVGLLADYFIRQNVRGYAVCLVGLYALIGFFPYGFTMGFEGRGGLTILAYPRLFLLLAMFATCARFVWGKSTPSPAPRLRDLTYSY